MLKRKKQKTMESLGEWANAGLGLVLFILGPSLYFFGRVVGFAGFVATILKIFDVEALASWTWAETIGMFGLGVVTVIIGRVLLTAIKDVVKQASKGY